MKHRIGVANRRLRNNHTTRPASMFKTSQSPAVTGNIFQKTRKCQATSENNKTMPEHQKHLVECLNLGVHKRSGTSKGFLASTQRQLRARRTLKAYPQLNYLKYCDDKHRLMNPINQQITSRLQKTALQTFKEIFAKENHCRLSCDVGNVHEHLGTTNTDNAQVKENNIGRSQSSNIKRTEKSLLISHFQGQSEPQGDKEHDEVIDERKTHELLANLTALRKKSHPVMKKRGPAQNYVSIGSYPDPVASKLESNLQTIPYEYNSSAKREDLNKLQQKPTNAPSADTQSNLISQILQQTSYDAAPNATIIDKTKSTNKAAIAKALPNENVSILANKEKAFLEQQEKAKATSQNSKKQTNEKVSVAKIRAMNQNDDDDLEQITLTRPSKTVGQGGGISQECLHSTTGNAREPQLGKEEMVQLDGEEDLIEELMFYFDRIDNIGEYRLKSNKFYKENSGLSEIQPVNLIAAYYLSQQFYYYTCRIKDVLQNPSNQRNFFTLKPGEIIKAIADEEVREELAETEGKIEIAKKVVKQAHDACRSYLPTEEKTLNYRSQVNYCGKCCSQLGTQFRKMHQVYAHNRGNKNLALRCCYLIETYCLLKLLNAQEVKEYQDPEEIQDLDRHINTYSKLFYER